MGRVLMQVGGDLARAFGVTLALGGAAGAALALGPAAPFTPPSLGAVVTEPSASESGEAGAPSGLMLVRLGSRPQALIDGRWVAPGQKIRGARLTQLSQHGVTLTHADGKRSHLGLYAAPAASAPANAASAGIGAAAGDPQ